MLGMRLYAEVQHVLLCLVGGGGGGWLCKVSVLWCPEKVPSHLLSRFLTAPPSSDLAKCTAAYQNGCIQKCNYVCTMRTPRRGFLRNRITMGGFGSPAPFCSVWEGGFRAFDDATSRLPSFSQQ